VKQVNLYLIFSLLAYMVHHYPPVVAVGVIFAVGSGALAQMTSSESDVGQILVILTALIGSIGGVITAIGGIMVSLAKIKSENRLLVSRRLHEVNNLQNEINLLRLQLISKGGDPQGIEELLRGNVHIKLGSLKSDVTTERSRESTASR
jgi:hypothetical protein